MFGHVDYIVFGEFRPAIDRHLAVFGVKTHDNMAGKFQTDVIDKMRYRHRLGTNNDVLDTGIQISLNGLGITYAAAYLDWDVRIGLRDGLYDLHIFGFTGKGTV